MIPNSLHNYRQLIDSIERINLPSSNGQSSRDSTASGIAERSIMRSESPLLGIQTAPAVPQHSRHSSTLLSTQSMVLAQGQRHVNNILSMANGLEAMIEKARLTDLLKEKYAQPNEQAQQEEATEAIHAFKYLEFESSSSDQIIQDKFPLISAVEEGDTKSLDLLLTIGANIETRSHKGLTPFLLAAAKGDVPCMKILQAHHADIHAKTKNTVPLNALQLCSQTGSADGVRYLVRQGLTIDGTGKDGETALR